MLGTLSFTKDDPDAVDFVTAASNLRMWNYHIGPIWLVLRRTMFFERDHEQRIWSYLAFHGAKQIFCNFGVHFHGTFPDFREIQKKV